MLRRTKFTKFVFFPAKLILIHWQKEGEEMLPNGPHTHTLAHECVSTKRGNKDKPKREHIKKTFAR